MTAIEKAVVILTSPKRRGHTTPWRGGGGGEDTRESARVNQEKQGKMWAKAFIAVSAGNNRGDRLSKFRIDYFE